VPKARTLRIKKQNRRAEGTGASDFKVFTSINHVRFAHSWVDKKQKQNTGEVEDEIHFLFNCSKYEPDRKELVDIMFH
jgi:hypothetical protein